MWSNFSLALITLLAVLVVAFLWAVAVFAAGSGIPFGSVDLHLAVRNLFFCLAAFCLLWVTSQLPIRRPVVVKMMVGFGLLFFGAWQELLNTVVRSDWLIVRWLEMVGLPGGLLAGAFGLWELGKAYQLNRLLLGSYRKIEHNLATVDQLTQLYNRRYFFAVCPELMVSAQLHEAEPILLTLRIRNLQGTNQALGYQAGDAVLMQVAKSLQRHIRSSDIAARLSGRCFAMLLFNNRYEHAEEIVARLQNLAEHVAVANIEGDESVINIEIDYAISTAQPNETFEALTQRALKALGEPTGTKVPADLTRF